MHSALAARWRLRHKADMRRSNRIVCVALIVTSFALCTACGNEEPTNDQTVNTAQNGAGAGTLPPPSSPAEAGAPPLDARAPMAPVMDATSAPRNDASTPPASDASPIIPVDTGIIGASDAGDSGVVSDASTDGAAPFPRSADVNVSSKGPYAFKTYTDGLKDPAYDSAIMYYPENAPLPLAAIVFAPGFTATKENYTKLGEIFASHGFAMMLTTPTDTDIDFPPERGKDLVAAVGRIKLENERMGSPLQGKLAWDRVCVTGQSMGGGGTLWAATELGDKIRCAVPLQPWEPGTRFAMIKAPTLFIAAQSDTIAGVAENARVHYDSIPNTVEKIFAEFKGADHYLTTNRTTMWDDQARVMVPFYKLKLEDDMRYAAYLYGGMEPKEALSRYEYSKK
jgi:hypothetical protein